MEWPTFIILNLSLAHSTFVIFAYEIMYANKEYKEVRLYVPLSNSIPSKWADILGLGFGLPLAGAFLGGLIGGGIGGALGSRPWGGFGYPGVGYPGMGYPGMGYPGMGYPGMGYPGFGYPGMTPYFY